MMSQIKAPIYSQRNPVTYYTLRTNANYNWLSRLYLKSFGNLDSILVPVVITHSFFNYLNYLKNIAISLAEATNINEDTVVQPNHEVAVAGAGDPNPYKKHVYLSSTGYKI